MKKFLLLISTLCILAPALADVLPFGSRAKPPLDSSSQPAGEYCQTKKTNSKIVTPKKADDCKPLSKPVAPKPRPSKQ